MKCFFYKLSRLQSLGYALRDREAVLEYEKDLGDTQIDFIKDRIKSLKQEITDLEREIISDINSLGGERVC